MPVRDRLKGHASWLKLKKLASKGTRQSPPPLPTPPPSPPSAPQLDNPQEDTSFPVQDSGDRSQNEGRGAATPFPLCWQGATPQETEYSAEAETAYEQKYYELHVQTLHLLLEEVLSMGPFEFELLPHHGEDDDDDDDDDGYGHGCFDTDVDDGQSSQSSVNSSVSIVLGVIGLDCLALSQKKAQQAADPEVSSHSYRRRHIEAKRAAGPEKRREVRAVVAERLLLHQRQRTSPELGLPRRPLGWQVWKSLYV